MKYGLMRKVNKIVKISIVLLMVIFLEFNGNNIVLNAQNSNLNKKLNLNSFNVIDINLDDYQEPDFINQKETTNTQVETAKVNRGVLATYSSNMTGYVYNCPACSGKLACNSQIDLSTGNINYYDQTYGNVRIVASSSNLECGSIVSIKSNKFSEPILAIVLDRGVYGNTLDLLTSSVEDARVNVGNMQITYDVLRNGY